MIRTALLSSRARIALLCATLLLGATVPVQAGGGNVMPATARPKGFSLADAAAAEAYFNAGDRSDATPPPRVFRSRSSIGDPRATAWS